MHSKYSKLFCLICLPACVMAVAINAQAVDLPAGETSARTNSVPNVSGNIKPSKAPSAAESVEKTKPSWGSRILFYIPNRTMDFLELDPGVEWKEEDDYKTAYFIRIGLEMLFQ